jgi:transcriptional regulator with XRE-family HTH domain
MNDIEALRRFKDINHLTYPELAERLGVSARNLFRWLHKEHEPGPMGKKIIHNFLTALDHTKCDAE